MKKTIQIIFLLLFMAGCVSCGIFSVQRDRQLYPVSLSADTAMQIKYLADIKIVKDRLYITYENGEDYGRHRLCSYDVDFKKSKLKFNKELSEGYDNIYIPVTFWNNKGDMYVADGYNPDNIYIVRNDTLCKTDHSLFSNNAEVPYEMSFEAKQVFYKSPREYYFIGRRPKSGIMAIYHSDNNGSKQVITEVKRIIYDERYPSWVLNHGNFSYNQSKQKGVYAFEMFPAIQFFDFAKDRDKVIKVGKESFDSETLSEGDLWENNTTHFKALCTTEKYVYALYWGMKVSEIEAGNSDGTVKTKIIKYDWNGNIKKTYVIDKGLQNFCVTGDNKNIIAYDGKEFLLIKL